MEQLPPLPFDSSDQVDMEYLIRRAYVVSELSPDPSTQNGALLGHPSHLSHYSAGWNAPVGDALARIGLTDRGFKMLVTEHAERNAIYSAARRGIATEGATLVCPWAACSECARGIVEAGVTRLIRHGNVLAEMPERWRESVALGDLILAMGGVEVVSVYTDHPYGIAVRFDGKTVER